ncbi:MAG: hypothetical protein A49_08470 [Methyloceanibacter sp.]|nr:MAG: hypothetical protein A49_08470 [Methyloceanibacter sp.]
MDFVLATFWVLVGVAIYFLPGLLASFRKHRNHNAIFVLNLLLGWTVIGWIVALIWAFTNPARQTETGGS